MVVVRYALYFLGVALVTWLLTQFEIASPGSLKLQLFTHADDKLGTSEFSPIELMQSGMLLVCGLLFAWVAQHSLQQRPVALTLGAFAAIFLVRELDYFLDRYIVDNFWQVPVAIIMALLLVYTWRHQKRLRLAWTRIWPSPGLTLLFAGMLVHFAFAPFVGHEPFWQAALGDDYRRIVKITAEEFTELVAYFLWLIGSCEYMLQARAIAARDPHAAHVHRQQSRQGRGDGSY